jgi:hypothetical protein
VRLTVPIGAATLAAALSTPLTAAQAAPSGNPSPTNTVVVSAVGPAAAVVGLRRHGEPEMAPRPTR